MPVRVYNENITGNGMSTLVVRMHHRHLPPDQPLRSHRERRQHRPFRLVRPLVPAGRRSWHCAGNVRLAR